VLHWWERRDTAMLVLGMWRNANFAVGCGLSFVVGVVLCATLALLPPFLARLLHYPILDIGLLLAPRGMGTMLGMLLVGRLVGRIDARWPIATGMAMMALSLELMSGFGPEVTRASVVWIGVLQGLGLGLVFVPIASVAYATLPVHQRTEAAGLFSLVRNVGSSVGISVVMTLLARLTQFNHAELVARIPAYGAETALVPSAWNPLTAAGAMALDNEVTRQALVLAYLDDFRLLMWLTVIAMPMVFFLRARNAAPASAADAPH
jgi:DHA2 family multidrug resistance protein